MYCVGGCIAIDFVFSFEQKFHSKTLAFDKFMELYFRLYNFLGMYTIHVHIVHGVQFHVHVHVHVCGGV